MSIKAAAPSVGHVYRSRDHRDNGRRVKVTKVISKSKCVEVENTKTRKATKMTFANLKRRFDRVGK